MSKPPLLDTHIWLWWLIGDSRLSAEQIETLEAFPSTNRPYICDISIWELGMLVDLGRLELNIPFDDFLRKATSPATVQVLPISSEVVLEMNQLPESFHKDPADRLIVSTSRALDLPLATQDYLILNSGLISQW